MSSHHNRRKRRSNTDAPVLVERVQKAEQGHEQPSSQELWKGRPRTGNYEVDNWPWLSPKFREAHNRRLQARGLPTIPPPLVDLYVPPPAIIREIDYNDREFVGATREFLGGTLMGGGEEGFTVNGKKTKL